MAGRALSSSRKLQRTVGSIANGPLFSRDSHSMRMKPDQRFQFVFKPTTSCNLACKYCYAAKDRLEGKSCVIGLSEAKKAFDWASRFCHEFNVRSVSVLWHGGEPLLLGADFLDEVASYYKTLFAKSAILTNRFCFLAVLEAFCPRESKKRADLSALSCFYLII